MKLQKYAKPRDVMETSNKNEILSDLITQNAQLSDNVLDITRGILDCGKVVPDEASRDNPFLYSFIRLNGPKREAFSLLLKNLESSKQSIDSLSEGFKNDEYNQPYIQHSIGRIQSLNKLLEQFQERAEQYTKADEEQEAESAFMETTDCLNQNLNPNLDDLFEHFKYGNKNYIIFGKNGSGKTSLLRKITTDIITENIVIIPANRIVNVDNHRFIEFDTQLNLNDKLADSNSIRYLVDALDTVQLEEYRQQKSYQDSIYLQFTRIFSALGLERDVSIKDKVIKLNLPGKVAEKDKYLLSQASDGERTVVYMILAVLLAPLNAFIFIDEPENHLNGSLMRKLFDALEFARKDARFVYLTHKTDFIESRTNYQLIYLQKTDEPDNWEYKDISNYADISLSVILDIEGSLDNIIFCEGTLSSIDGNVLTALYPNYTVRPSGSCVEVRKNTEAINSQSSLFRRRAIGVVDGDFQIDEEIRSLKEKKVMTLAYNEWESLLLDEDLLAFICEQIPSVKISQVKDELINRIEAKKTDILNDYLTKRYSAIISKSKISVNSSKELENRIDELNKENKDSLLEMYNQFANRLNHLIQKRDYSELIKTIPGRMFLDVAARAAGLRNGQIYVSSVLHQINTNTEFRDKIKEKLGLEVFYNKCFCTGTKK